jgi:hypothetical protein
MNDLHWMTLVESAGAIAARKLSPVELMSALLERIGRLDPKLNVFIRLDREAAMEEAKAAEAEIVSDRLRGPLHGVPARTGPSLPAHFADAANPPPGPDRRQSVKLLPILIEMHAVAPRTCATGPRP